MKFLNTSAGLFAFAILSTGCVVGGKITPTLDAPTPTDVARLWQEPADLANRDLFHGPGGAELMPATSTTFTFVAADQSGYSAGYDVRDPNGMEWSVKLGPEAQPEVAVSRILWALGYHQPPAYYLPPWTMTGTQAGPQAAARFRPKLPDRKVVGEWSWYENDFINTQPFKGLVVVNVMLNNWDWKTSNNKIYEVGDEGQSIDRMYVVQDLGASLGKTSYPKMLAWLPMRGLGQGSRNDLADFEEQGFIKRVEGERVDFFYRGIHHSLIEQLTARDVVWTAELMSRLSDEQWHDAFRAAGYSDDHARRYVAKIQSKVAEGLKLARPEA
jgi:hypothetical protein